jgi:hypothetical protein
VNMRAIGTVWIGEFRVWVNPSTPVAVSDPSNPNKQIEEPYYDVLVVKEESPKIHTYINLVKDDQFKYLFDLDDRGYPTDHTDMAQFQAYQDRKNMGQPMWKLSSKSLERLFGTLLHIDEWIYVPV